METSNNCHSECDRLVELRVYQPYIEKKAQQQKYQLVLSVPVPRVEEYAAIAPLSEIETEGFASTRAIPFTGIKVFDNAPPSGIWLNLTGEIERSDTQVLYGYIFHYNHNYLHLSPMTHWSSMVGQHPQWRQVTGGEGSTLELVVNQSIGLEPKFAVYRLEPRNFTPNPIELTKISLSQPAIAQESFQQDYRQALKLSNNGLWSPAWEKLKVVKQKATGKFWTTEAQAQLDVIGIHAQQTKGECDKSWASPSQQFLACLIDGRFLQSLERLELSVNNSTVKEITTLLKTESGRLWKRVEATLEVDEKNLAAKAWGSLILAARKDREAGLQWLENLPETKPEEIRRIATLLDQMELAVARATPRQKAIAKLLGTAQIVQTVNPKDWLLWQDTSFPVPNPEERWYQIRIKTYHDGQSWQKPPFPNLELGTVEPGKQLGRQLGLDFGSSMQITAWTPEGQGNLHPCQY